jgi:hypothetical protein
MGMELGLLPSRKNTYKCIEDAEEIIWISEKRNRMAAKNSQIRAS